MTTRIYYVNPANTADITYVGREGDTKVTLPDGRPIERLQHEPTWDVYLANEDNTNAPAYHFYDNSPTTVFVGTVGADASRVQETRNHTPFDLPFLYEEKKREIVDYDREVRFNSFPTSLHPTWQVVSTDTARTELGSQAGALAAGTPFPANASKHPYLAIYNPSNTNDPYRRNQVNESQYQTVTRELAEHDQETGNATEASQNSLATKYDDGAGDWQTVADHDARDPAWGYPAYTVIQSQHIQ